MYMILLLLFILGAIIGSFLNVVIYRLHTGKSLSGHSHCLSCGTRLSWYELIPLISYVCIRGRCRHCGAYVPFRYFFVELLTAGAFVLAGMLVTTPILLGLHLVAFSAVIVILLYDLRHMIIPNEVAAVLFGAAFLIILFDPDRLLSDALLGAVSAGLFYATLWYVSKGRWMGLGDAKLAVSFGLLLGWPMALSFIVWSFWIGAAVSIVFVGFVHAFHYVVEVITRISVFSKVFPKHRIANYGRYLTMKSEVPFAPFLIAAFFVMYIFELDVLTVVARLFDSPLL